MLAGNALAAEPPLGKVRDFVLEDGMLDLKKYGSRLFVDAARILGLASGCDEVGTVARLRHAAAGGRLTALEAEAAVPAFYHLQRVRLQHQYRTLATGISADNRLDPERLNEFDRRMLLESLKQARLLQQRLKTAFRIEG
jgi:CBS domain-containing protein